ncbi:MAG: LabA-like NYN domain-containing protein [Ktedonobacteraceae bacterium]
MTTQHSYPEHNDVDTSVVEDAHASETTTSSPSATETPSTGEETPEQPATQDIQFAGGQTPQALAVTEAQEGSTSTPTPEHEEQDSATGSGDATNEGEVKTFTAFIEEFRQAEARFGRAVQEARTAQEDTNIQASATSSIPSAPSAPISSVEEVFVPEFTMPWETPHIVATPTIESTEETTLTTEPKASVEETLTTETTTSVEAPESAETTQATEATETAAPTARPVSPLLRPASRLRLPRHNTRHREEARTPAADVTIQPDQLEPQAEQSARTGATGEPTVNPAETTPTEQPRPARRYRFDNHSKTAPAASTTPTPAAVPVPADTGLTNGHTQTAQPVERETQQTNPTSTITHQPEQTIAKSTPDAEPTATENTGAVATAQPQPATEPERRRKQHGQERQRGKEQAPSQATQPQPPPTTVAEIATTLNAQQAKPAVVEPVAEQKDSIEPEDLPPLEYADLQKANTRRRRRRHTNGASVATLTGNTLPTTPEIPAVTSVAPIIQPRSIATLPPIVPQRPLVTPATPVPQRPATASAAMPQRPAATPPSAVTTNQAPFTITSGYTVNQMNQGNDNVGPFMGPDPSPARGTMAAQNTRSIRTDAQRTPAYPVRTTEATSASVNQLANIVSQAIQTQTDRMVAELRRANQAPTNISVSMPPFPSNERVGVFVDVANLLYSARTLRMAVDFGKLLDFLRGNRHLIRAQAYCPTSPQPGDEQMFLQAVKGLGYRITTKNYKTFSSGAKKADLDLDLCMDVVRLVDGNAVDCIVLVSGDSDFMPMLDYCSDHGVRVEVAAFDEAMSGTLRQSCDLFINLSMLEEIRA